MFQKLKQRFHDVQTIKTLCEGAERHANSDGQLEPGAEHFILAALELPDGTAQKAFQRVNADPAQFSSAIARQYADALGNVGVHMPEEAPPVAHASERRPYKASASGQALFQMLVGIRESTSNGPLLGAHVLIAASMAQYGVVPRALRCMGIDPATLQEAARAEIVRQQCEAL